MKSQTMIKGKLQYETIKLSKEESEKLKKTNKDTVKYKVKKGD
jgi:hypothetical protein